MLKLGLAVQRLFAVRPAAFGRLCVETVRPLDAVFYQTASRLRAAVC